MSAQLIELLFFAVIAFLIINKLISILGATSEDDSTNNTSLFGEPTSIKDVTNSANVKSKNSTIKKYFIWDQKIANFDPFIKQDNREFVLKGLAETSNKIPSFNLEKFVNNAKSAFKMIIECAKNNDKEFQSLIDKRYLEAFQANVARYKNNIDIATLNAQISSIYTFGNNVFITLEFSGKNVINNDDSFSEEWTFTKNVTHTSPNWYLSNIDR